MPCRNRSNKLDIMLGLNVGSSCQFVKGCQINTAAALILSPFLSSTPASWNQFDADIVVVRSPIWSAPRIGQTVTPERRLDFVRRTLIDSESTMTHWSTTIPTYLKADWFGQEVSGEWRRRSKDRIGIYNQSNHDLVKRFQVRASLGKDEKMVKGLDRIYNGWVIIALHIIKTRERTIKKDRRLQWKSDHLSPSLTFARDQDLLPPSFEASWDPVRLLWTLDIVQTDTVLPFPSFPPSFPLPSLCR